MTIYTKTQLQSMKAIEVYKILEDRNLATFGWDKKSAIDAIVAHQTLFI